MIKQDKNRDNYSHWLLKNYIPDYVCDTLLQNNSDWENGSVVSDDPLGKARDSDISWVYSDFWKQIFWGIAQNVNHQWGINFDIQTIEPLQLTRYIAPNGHYDFHLDSTGIGHADESGLVRKLSMICLLNEKSEFEGGDFEMLVKSNADKIELNKGDVVVFPSYFLHRVSPVTKGTRYSVVAWALGDMIR
tara:strand:+ start:69 stop:638 length:570 start_codon:yes stop_codon:yes gene_type:complete